MQRRGKQMSLLHRVTCLYMEAETALQRIFLMYAIPLYPFSKATRIHIPFLTVPQERAPSAQSK